MRPMLIIAGALLLGGCLSDIVPLYASEEAPIEEMPDMTPAAEDLTPAGDGNALNTNCINAQAPNGDGHHNPGLTCISAGCHDGNTAGAPLYTVAGTLFAAVSGTAPVAGATIEITSMGGAKLTLVTATNGNFFTEQPVTFPLQVRASKCPDDKRMPDAVAATGAACNSCHTAGVTGQMHLP